MEPTDELLSLDLCQDDCFYRFRRATSDFSTVVYVHLQHLDIIPEDCQTYGPDVVRELKRRVKAWDEEWTTLTICKDAAGEIQSRKDCWQPHHLPSDVVLEGIPRLNVLDLEIEQRLTNRVFRIRHAGHEQILKICPFAYELPYMKREMHAYNTLKKRDCPIVPSIAAYVYERSSEQVVGFICEQFYGTFAGPDDYPLCRRGLQELHSFGVVHGDLNKYNILMTADGPRFFDLEKALLGSDEGISETEFSRQKHDELDRLEKALLDEEGWGKPWHL